MGIFQQSGTRAVGGDGGLLQHLSENVACLVHALCDGIILGGVDVNSLAADRTMQLCLWGADDPIPRRCSLLSDSQRQCSDSHNGMLLLESGSTIQVEGPRRLPLSEVTGCDYAGVSQ